MTQAMPIISRPLSSKIEAVNYLTVADSPIDRILQKISKMELPDRVHFESYMRYKWRMNHKPSTLLNSFHAVSSFLTFYHGLGKRQLQDIMRDDIEAFVEHEQDRGLKVTTARTRLNSLCQMIGSNLYCSQMCFYPAHQHAQFFISLRFFPQPPSLLAHSSIAHPHHDPNLSAFQTTYPI